MAKMIKNCAVMEVTADGVRVGRCWAFVGHDYICPRHGNVRRVQEDYAHTGKLTDETEHWALLHMENLKK